MKTSFCYLLLTFAAGVSAIAADEIAMRLNKTAAVLAKMTKSEDETFSARVSSADCVAVIPGFKKGAAGVGVGFGRGFISCRKDTRWSAPAAVSLESASLGVQVGGEEIDIVMLSLDKERRSKLLSERFTIGSDASAAWGNGKSAHEDSNVQIFFYGETKGVFAGFGLDGATLKRDRTANKALYGRDLTNEEIVQSGSAPTAPQPFADKPAHTANQ